MPKFGVNERKEKHRQSEQKNYKGRRHGAHYTTLYSVEDCRGEKEGAPAVISSAQDSLLSETLADGAQELTRGMLETSIIANLCIGWVREAFNEGLVNYLITFARNHIGITDRQTGSDKVGHQTTRARKNWNNNPRTIHRNPETSQQTPTQPNVPYWMDQRLQCQIYNQTPSLHRNECHRCTFYSNHTRQYGGYKGQLKPSKLKCS